MAATNYTPIQLYFSTTASAVPLAANLAQGELAINITDGKLYYEDNGGVVQVIATKGAGTIGGSTTQIQYNNAGALAGNAAMVFNNSTNVTTLTTLNLTNALGAIYGGTAQSTYTQGDVLYASAANTLSKLGIGTVNYILTSSGSVPQWSAPSSISVLTATNLAGGLAGSVPYQSALDTTTFLAIGAANRVMTSTGSAPQWVTSLTSLTGVSSSSITNTSLTSGRVVFSGASGLESDSASLTFNGTTLSAGGFSTTGLSTLVQTVKIGDSNFSGVAVFAPATPAKLYMGTGTVTDVTSAVSATNTTGAIASLAITPIAATNTGVTYTNASTLYIAGAPSAGTNITITNPYALYVAAGASYLGGAVTIGGNTAVTGSLSTTGLITSTSSANSTVTTGVFENTSTGTSAINRFRLNGGTSSAIFEVQGSGFSGTNITNGPTTSALAIWTSPNIPVSIGVNASEIGRFSSTGLAVTGTLSATGNLTSPTVQIGTNPAGVSIGVLGIPNQKRIYGRNAANSADVSIAYVNSSNGLVLGPTDSVTISSAGNVDMTGNVDISTGGAILTLNRGQFSQQTKFYQDTGGTGAIYETTNPSVNAQYYAHVFKGTNNVPTTVEYGKFNQFGLGLGGASPSSGTGIAFPATQSASTDANTLDDYEEGTWTPLVQNASATESASAGANGTYVKVGKMVYVTINLYALNVSGITASSHLYIRGLPFEISYGNAQALFMVYPAVPVSTVDVSSTQLPLYISNNATDYSQFSRNSWGGASSITLRGCFVYQSAA